jgi:D-serine deaminase-like pyridoxal phosphate-dependent protein
VTPTIHDLNTPALVIDLDVMMSNIWRLQNYLDAHGIANRPHVKTHKMPVIARRQLEAGAVGITCQKLGEAEVMADAGIQNILLTYNIVGRQKLERLVGLAKRTHLTVTADSLVVAQGLSRAIQAAGVTIGVLVELASEMERTGVPTPAALVELSHQVVSLPGLQLRGLMIYPSGRHNADHIAEAVDSLRSAGLPTEIVSGGGTKTAFQAHEVREVNEYRAGTYIFNDKMTVEKEAAKLDECALSVIVTVVSRPTRDRAIIDAGSKTFSSDFGLPMGYIVDYPEAQIYKMNEEHGYVDVSLCAFKPEVGDRLRVIPNHACGTVNMHDVAYAVRGDEVEAVWDIQARGRTC